METLAASNESEMRMARKGLKTDSDDKCYGKRDLERKIGVNAKRRAGSRNHRPRCSVYYPTDDECNPPFVTYAKEYPPPLRRRHNPQPVKGLYVWDEAAEKWVVISGTSSGQASCSNIKTGHIRRGGGHYAPDCKHGQPRPISFDDADSAACMPKMGIQTVSKPKVENSSSDLSKHKEEEADSSSCHNRKSISFLSWNIWFDDFEWERRGRAILQIIEAKKPTVVALQEVGRDGGCKILEQILLRNTFIRKHYFVTDFRGRSVVMLSKIKGTVERINLVTEMSRFCLILRVVLNGESFIFATTHLESVDRLRRRRKQIGQIARYLSKSPADHIALAGDFNFGDKNHPLTHEDDPRENDNLGVLLPSFVDLWPAIYGDNDPGFTMDTKANRMFMAQKGFDKQGKGEEQMRLDRVLFHTSTDTWTVTSIEMIGKEELGVSEENKWPILPSDHFGLLTSYHTNNN
mmetsp:Transcript_45003/g.75071  ORF Transcript_45003/g.75071 Transcript_45003/m.75071 type:complete len:462 (+) Transcript_45003:41-1426(+)